MNFYSMPRRAPGGSSDVHGTRSLPRIAMALGSVVLLAAASGSFAVAPAAAMDPTKGPAQGSIMYQEALTHAGDANTFTPGDAVTVGYTPRRGDKTLVDGHRPMALPAGTASGRSMAAAPDGVRASDDAVPGATPFPAPSGDAATLAAAAAAVPATTSPNSLRREVLGFLPYWESPYSGSLNDDLLSTIAYFGVTVRGDGTLAKSTGGVTTNEWAGWTSSWMTNVINTAHAHGTRVLLSVEQFAWTAGGRSTQVMLLSDASIRAKAVGAIVDAVTQRGADGVALDFEPIASGQSANFVSFVRELRTALDKVKAGYEIVYCATGSIGYYDHLDLTGPGAADSVFIMGYDFRTGSSGYAGSIDPLTSPRNVYDLTQVIGLYKARVSLSKVILGLPWYGIAWSVSSNAPNATVINSKCSATSVLFAQAAALAATNGRNYDSIEQSAWTAYKLSCGDTDSSGAAIQTWRELYYDDAQSLGVKYDMINYWNLRGMGIWALGYDHGHPEISALIANKFLNDKTPPETGIVNMPSTQASEGFQVSWTGHDDWNGVASYDVQVSTDRGAWTDWLTHVTETSDSYQGLSGHNYSFRVRATDGAGNTSPWDVTSVFTGSPTYAVGAYVKVAGTAISERAGASSTATAVATAAPGTVLQIIGGPTTTADNITWYQVTGPFTTVNATAPLYPGLWVAATNGTTDWVIPITPPNTTTVSAGLADYQVGVPGMRPSGTGIDRGKVFSPDGDGIRDTLPMTWSNQVAMDSVTLTVYKADGTSAGSIPLGAQGAGDQSFVWDGKVGGTVLPDGQYMLQLSGVAGSATYYAPSAAPFGDWQMSRLSAVIDTTASGTYFPITPTRIVDTRVTTTGTLLKGALVAGQARKFVIAGAVAGVPKKAMAVTGNLTITAPTAGGHVTLGSAVTNATSTINFAAGQTRANGVTLGLATDGSLTIEYFGPAGNSVQAVFDLTGYFLQDPTGATYFPVSPARIVDTRTKGHQLYGALVPGKVSTFGVSGLAGIPSNATAITGNVTISGGTGNGYVTVAPTIATTGPAQVSTLNFGKGETAANNVVLQLGGGKLQVKYTGTTGSTVQFIFDVTGYFVPGLSGATFVPLTPGRVADSRSAKGFTGPLRTGSTATFAVSGQVSVHPIAVAVVGNLTVTQATSAGWLAIGPVATTSTSTLNFLAVEARANGFAGLLGVGGRLAVTFGGATASSTQVVCDILGYYR
jgi:spore germination protein YaaH